MEPVTVRRFFEVLGEFLARYWIFLLFWAAAIFINLLKFRRWRSRGREIADPSLTPDWTDRRTSMFSDGVQGNWQGHAMTVRRFPSTDRSREAIEATLRTSAPGRFVLERGGVALFGRQFRIGAPPLVEPMSPDDQKLFRIRTTDRTLTDRLLADANARAAILESLRGGSDEVSLHNGRLRIRRRFPRNDGAGPMITQSLAALKEMSRVLG